MTSQWNDRLFMTRAQIRRYDEIAIGSLGMPGPVLMESAGAGAALIARRMLGDGRLVAVVAGPGNNGGDGFVVARHLINAGLSVRTYLAIDAAKITGDAALNYALLSAMKAKIVDVGAGSETGDLAKALRGHDLIVDALLGTGVTREVEGRLGELIDAVNAAKTPVLSLDIPSGLDADTGAPRGKAVAADETATFGHLKRGLLLHPGAALAGRVTVVPIGVPAFVSDEAGWDGLLLDEPFARRLLPRRSADAHKGVFGHLLVVAGSPGMTGAAILASGAAMRAGTGLVTVATQPQAQALVAAGGAEVMVDALVDERLDALLRGKSALAVGPGLGTSTQVASQFFRLLDGLEIPAVIDADGLNLLAGDPSALSRARGPVVLTPHPGEMARLAGLSTAEVQADRIGVAREVAGRLEAVVVLKGAGTVIAAPDGRVFVCPAGNPGMASGGMGDVLTGIVGAFLAQGLEALDAALLGTYLHGAAGDAAAERLGEPSLIASDVIAAVPDIMLRWSAKSSSLTL